MVLGKGWLFSIGNGAEIRPIEKGRKSPVCSSLNRGIVLCHLARHFIIIA